MHAPRLHRPVVSLLLAALLATARVFASSCTIVPTNPVAGQTVTVVYDKTGGPLAASPNIRLHRGINGWSPVSSPDPQMIRDTTAGTFSWSFTTPEPAYAIDFAFNSVESPNAWDNNSGQDWHFAVTAAAAPGELPVEPLPSGASKAHVMMQGFYWDVPAGGTWYTFVASKAAALRDMRDGHGIDRIWFPPPSKGDSGAFSMGYDPYDYYDLGAYNQKGTTAGRFGTQTQLKSAIAAFKAQGIAVLADIVANHRGGGAAESNPNTSGSTYTNFSQVASGRATWHYNQFHPSTYEHSDDMAFSGFADVCLAAATPDVVGSPRRDLIDWMVWLRDPANAGFDGWRLDLAQGYRPSFVVELRRATANAFAVMEKWDTNTRNLEAHVVASGGTHTFDFAAYYTMRTVCVSPATANIADLVDPTKVYAARNPAKAVTFCENHDTDKDPSQYLQNKMLSYAFILTYQGYPCLFWRDYFDYGLATLGGQSGNGINALVWARGALSGGQPVIELLKSDARDHLIYGTVNGRRAAPGCITVLNSNTSSTRSATVTTTNPTLQGKTLRCYAWYSYVAGMNAQPSDVACDANGSVTVQAPALGYAVYGPADLVGTPPVIIDQPAGQTVTAGSPVALSVHASGTALTYQWRLNGSDIAGATASTLALPRAQAFHGGAYTVVVSDGVDTLTSQPALVTIQPAPASDARLMNISTRGLSLTGDRLLIPGFVVEGTGTKRLLIRAVGPTLENFGISSPLANPTMTVQTWNAALNNGQGAWEVVAANDDWVSNANRAEIVATTAAVGAFPLIDPSADAAVLREVGAGRYSVVASGVSGGTGVAIVEVYDADNGNPATRLINISNRGFVGAGDEIMIPGFVVSQEGARTFLIRAVGPALSQFGVAEVLADPVLYLYEKVQGASPADQLILTNDDWDGHPGSANTAAVASAVGAFPLPSASGDAAFVVTLPPGIYTAIVRGKNGTSGVGLAEVYLVP